MKRGFLPLALLAGMLTAQSTVVSAQTDVTVPGGATGGNVVCLQAGDINSGAFVGTYLETAPHTWEERLKAGTFKLQERKRDDVLVELFDDSRAAVIQFDFLNRTVKYKPSSSKDKDGKDRYYILNATDKNGSKDCMTLAAANAADAGGGPGGGGNGPGGNGPGGGGGRSPGGGGGGGAGRPPPNMVLINVPPRSPFDIPPGTILTAVGGQFACPGRPGFFLCPNKFSCAPLGGVCCPGVGACNAGAFCDHFVPNHCILPSDVRFCPGTGNQATGFAVHCAPGLACVGTGGNLCQ
jgi:hypothetical protein